MINYDSLLSDQVKRMQPSGIRKFFDVAAMMEGVISLGVGEPDFQTPWVVRKEAVDILERKRIIYSANSGMMNLRKEIANYLNRKYDLTYDPDSEVIATVGGSEAIDLAIRAIVNPGDEVLVVEPSFVCYKPIVELMHGVAVPIPTKEENKFKLTPEEFEKIQEDLKAEDSVKKETARALEQFISLPEQKIAPGETDRILEDLTREYHRSTGS